MLSHALNFFVASHCLVALGGALAWGLRKLGNHRRVALSAGAELKIHYALLALLAVALFAPSSRREDFVFHPIAHVELARTPPRATRPAPPVLKLPGAAARSAGLPLEACAWAALLLTFAGLGFTALDYLRLARLLRRSFLHRRIGRVRIAFLDGIRSPFSARLPGAAWVVLPPSILRDPLDTRVAVAHELQHHRARDTLWCHAAAGLRALCFFHPLRALWAAVLAEAQELACDEVLVRKRRISAGDYSRCLIRAAETSARERAGRAIAAAPALFSARRLLARRIESMYQSKRNNRLVALGLALFAGGTLAAGAWASGEWVVDSRVSAGKMEEMAEEARRGTGFPIEVNDLVLRELNRFLGTEKGREFVAKAEDNLSRLRPVLDREIAGHRVPEELLAVGLVESGFENLPQSANPSQHGAGVWQFIPSTARVFGMRVDEKVDERLDIARETDAAFRYLAANQLRFGDWRLALMAYNTGERALDAAIRHAGTRDPWRLIRLGYENDDGYLAKVMAAVLILKDHEKSR